jgi:hypothetical protein
MPVLNDQKLILKISDPCKAGQHEHCAVVWDNDWHNLDADLVHEVFVACTCGCHKFEEAAPA